MSGLEISVEPSASIADSERFRTEVQAHRPESPSDTIRHGLALHNLDARGDEVYQPLRVFLRPTGLQTTSGGLLGDTGRGALHITELWVHPEFRRAGYGTQLLAAAESEAEARGCSFAYVESFSFHAPGFYLGQGYEQFGILPGFSGGHTCYFLRKGLPAA